MPYASRARALKLAAAAAVMGNAVSAWALATATWDGNVVAGDWTTGSRWSTNPVFPNNGQPGAGDTYNAVITAGNVGLNQDITLQSFVHSGINTFPNTNDLENFSTTTHTLTLNGLFDWSGGDLEGNVTVAANGGINISGTNLKRMPVRDSGGTTALIPVVNNTGAATWSGAGVNTTILSIGPNVYYATFNNLASATFDAQSDLFFNVQFNNSGTFTRSTGTGTARFQLPFNNNGTVTVSSGGLELNTGGTSNGTFIVNAGRRLFLYGNHNLTSSSVVTGAGTVQFSNPSGQGTAGEPIVAGSYNPAATVFDNRVQFDSNGSTGTLLINSLSGNPITGSGTLTVAGPTTYQSGNFSGDFTLNAQSGVNFATTANPRWNGNTVLNLAGGTSTWTGAFSILSFEENAKLNVLGGATFSISDAVGTRTIRTATTPGTFTNAGTLTKSGNLSTLSIEIPATNSGTVAISAGSLAFTTGGTSSGRIDIASPGTLRFGGSGTLATFTSTASSSFTGSGTVYMADAGTLNIGSSYNVGTTDLGSGVLPSYVRVSQGASQTLVTRWLHIPGSTGAWTATLDLTDNDMLINGAGPAAPSLATVFDQVKTARNNGTWDLPGITSAAARANAATGLGLLSGQEYLGFGTTTFNSNAVTASDVLVKYTWNGDTNFSGRVDFDDYVRTDVGFNTHLTGWSNGDFNYSGGVDFDDYVLIDVAFNTQSGTLGRAIAYLNGDDRSEPGRAATGVQKVVEHFEQFGLPYANAFLAAVPDPAPCVMLGVGWVSAVGVFRRRRVRRGG